MRSFSADLSVTGINIAKENAVIDFQFMIQGTPPKVEDKWVYSNFKHFSNLFNFNNIIRLQL